LHAGGVDELVRVNLFGLLQEGIKDFNVKAAAVCRGSAKNTAALYL
jgi:hypothetical protein